MLATLSHLEIGSPDCARLSEFYQQALGMTREAFPEHRWLCSGADRHLILAPGLPNSLGFAAYTVAAPEELIGLEDRLRRARVAVEPSPSPLFGPDALSFRDPDGTRLVFGCSGALRQRARPAPAAQMSGRLQHVVMASIDCERLARFYSDVLGFAVSDRVYRADGALMTCFLRSDDEHHSFAVFQAGTCRLDHYCLETAGWSAIRDWADHFARRGVRIQWGPGRHGPGNNLFIFIHDPDGNWVEFSAELERVPPDRPAGRWPHEERTLNLWGRAPLRD